MHRRSSIEVLPLSIYSLLIAAIPHLFRLVAIYKVRDPALLQHYKATFIHYFDTVQPNGLNISLGKSKISVVRQI